MVLDKTKATLIREIPVADELHEAYSLPDLEGVDFDWCDAPGFEKPRESLMMRLHLINEAATRIEEGKAEAASVGAAD